MTDAMFAPKDIRRSHPATIASGLASPTVAVEKTGRAKFALIVGGGIEYSEA